MSCCALCTQRENSLNPPPQSDQKFIFILIYMSSTLSRQHRERESFYLLQFTM
ncbi:hypothetical protein Scep_021847 [Stephania cephalantha]|uniref:Uncharacterized protein n=1 Tax=Stephania cephalantha TaxID=152367 RepID=A0AAP0F9A6_9MAGN